MAIELSLIRMLHPLQSCLNLVMVPAWTSYCFTGWSLIVCPGVSSHSVRSCFWWSNPFFPFFFREPLLNSSCNPVAVSLNGALYFSALVFTHTAMGDLLPSSDCIILSALGCKKRESRAITAVGQFYFTTLFCLLQSYSSSELMGSIALSFLKGRQRALPWVAAAKLASAWCLQWVSRFSIFFPFPLPLHTYTRLIRSPSTAAFFEQIPCLSRMRLIMLLSGFDLVQRYP